MACRISELVLKCRDPEALARFWCEVLDFVVLDREEDGIIEIGPREGFGGPQPTIILSRSDEPEPGRPGCTSTSTPPTAIRTPNSNASWKLGARPPTSARPGRSPGTYSPIPKATSSASSRPASTHSDGPGPSDRQCLRSATANKTGEPPSITHWRSVRAGAA